MLCQDSKYQDSQSYINLIAFQTDNLAQVSSIAMSSWMLPQKVQKDSELEQPIISQLSCDIMIFLWIIFLSSRGKGQPADICPSPYNNNNEGLVWLCYTVAPGMDNCRGHHIIYKIEDRNNYTIFMVVSFRIHSSLRSQGYIFRFDNIIV